MLVDNSESYGVSSTSSTLLGTVKVKVAVEGTLEGGYWRGTTGGGILEGDHRALELCRTSTNTLQHTKGKWEKEKSTAGPLRHCSTPTPATGRTWRRTARVSITAAAL